MNAFKVLYWDFNKDEPEGYDVLPYFRREYQEARKSDRPVTREQWTEFVKRKGKYMYWSRCEYETIISQWPPTDKKYKIDIWQQIELNLDLIVDLLMKEYE